MLVAGSLGLQVVIKRDRGWPAPDGLANITDTHPASTSIAAAAAAISLSIVPAVAPSSCSPYAPRLLCGSDLLALANQAQSAGAYRNSNGNARVLATVAVARVCVCVCVYPMCSSQPGKQHACSVRIVGKDWRGAPPPRPATTTANQRCGTAALLHLVEHRHSTRRVE